VKQVYIAGTLSALGTYGSVNGVLEYSVPDDGPSGGAVTDVAVGGGGLIGSWPGSDACSDGFGSGLSVTLDSDLGGHNLAEAIAQANALFPRSLTWQVPGEMPATDSNDPQPDPDSEGEPEPNVAPPVFDDVSETSISLSVEAVADACARLENDGWSLSLPVDLAATTEDGALQALYAGELTARSDAGGLRELSLRGGMDNVPVESFESSTGVRGVALTGYDYGRVSLWFQVEGAQGSLEVMGADVADCVNNPPEPIRDQNGNIVGSPGCRGTDLITLRRAVF
jgi:hypothetical protein